MADVGAYGFQRSDMALIFDSECYPNYYLASFLDDQTGEVFVYEKANDGAFDVDGFRALLASGLVVTFNGLNYDMPLALYALKNPKNAQIKKLSDKIIVGGMKPWDVRDIAKTEEGRWIDHIDLFNVAPGQCSLKTYGARLNSHKIQDLPFDPGAPVSEEQITLLREYCVNDLQTTKDLFDRLKPELQLRVDMTRAEKVDLRSKSDAQVAEAVLRKRIFGSAKPPANMIWFPGSRFKFDRPSFVKLENADAVRFMKSCDGYFSLTDDWKIDAPEGVHKQEIEIDFQIYRTGIGGIHSTEISRTLQSDDDFGIWDVDVTSYYPSIILRLGLEPESLRGKFLNEYAHIYEDRLGAKRTGNKVVADSLKIVLNGTFGKYGSRFSLLFSPALLTQTTITGQLSLLMLVEALTASGAQVVSANTDGVTYMGRRRMEKRFDDAVASWEQTTGFSTEKVAYRSLHAKDVNNYVAVKEGGGVKMKGLYRIGDLTKNPTNPICVRALVDHLSKGVPLEDTIHECRDAREFVTARAVRGGGVFESALENTYLGKTARWYYSTDRDGRVVYKANGNTVSRSFGCRPMMELTDEIPNDLDWEWYVSEAYRMLEHVGARDGKGRCGLGVDEKRPKTRRKSVQVEV